MVWIEMCQSQSVYMVYTAALYHYAQYLKQTRQTVKCYQFLFERRPHDHIQCNSEVNNIYR